MLKTCYSIPASLQYWLDNARRAMVVTYGVNVEPSPGQSPCRCRRCKPGENNAGKHPKYRWKEREEGLHDCQLNLAIDRYLVDNSSVGFALVLGRADLVILDSDPRNGGPTTIAELRDRFNFNANTPYVRTGGGGLHVYFHHAKLPFEKSQAILGPGVELLGGNHLAQIPPSVHRSGHEYRWAGSKPWDTPPAELPDHLAAMLQPKESPPISPSELRYAEMLRRRFDDQRIDRARAYLAKTPIAISGQGGWEHTNATVLKVVKGFSLDESEALAVLAEWNAGCLPPWKPAELRNKIRWALTTSGGAGFLLDSNRRHQNDPESKPVRFKIRPLGPGRSSSKSSTSPATEPGEELEPTPTISLDDFSDDYQPQTTGQFADDAVGPLNPNRRHFQSAEEYFEFEQSVKRREEEERFAAAQRAGEINELERIRHRTYPCENPKSIIHEVIDHKERRFLVVINPRCKLWKCPGCSSMHRQEYCDTFRHHLTNHGHRDGTAWTLTIPAAQATSTATGTITKAIRRAGGDYFWFDSAKGREIFANVEIKGGTETTRAAAADRLCALTWAYDGERKPSWHHSRRWKLLEPQRSKQPKKIVGVIDHDLEDLQVRVEPEQVAVESNGVPESWRHRIRQRRFINVTRLSEPKIERILCRIMDVPVHKVKYKARSQREPVPDPDLSESFVRDKYVDRDSDRSFWPAF